ncbi:MAG: EamA family transporter [Acidimicrobiia bacterium]
MSADHIVLAIVATLSVGSADLFGGIASRRSTPLAVAAWSQGIGVPIVALVAVAVGGQLLAADLALGVVAGVGSAVGVGALYRGFVHSDVGIVAPVAATTAAVLPMLVGFATGDRPTMLMMVGLGLAIVAIFLVGYVPGSDHGVTGIVYGLVSGLGFGCMVLAYAATSEESGIWSAVAGRLSATVLLAAVVLLTRSAWRIASDARLPTALAGVLAAVGMGAFVAVSQTAELFVLGVILGMFPVVTVILAAILLKEKLLASQWLGVALAGVAVVLINLGG